MRSEQEVRSAMGLVMAEYERFCRIAREHAGFVSPALKGVLEASATMHGVLGWVLGEVEASPDHPVNAFAELLVDLEEESADEVSEV
jgi:hypothetical protein